RVMLPEDLQVPALREIDIGGSDDVQVSGFYDKEGGGEHTVRWTGRCASVYLPGARGGDEVTVTTATGRRPVTAPLPVSVSIGGAAVGRFETGREWEEPRLRLPAPLPPGPPVLRFDLPTFRPANVWPGAAHPRDPRGMGARNRLTIA